QHDGRRQNVLEARRWQTVSIGMMMIVGTAMMYVGGRRGALFGMMNNGVVMLAGVGIARERRRNT
ncbi:hypothetical protein A2U01_0064029, partial [Trifolium medium]|nr:hypothetical protein [Trifolium medium]